MFLHRALRTVLVLVIALTGALGAGTGTALAGDGRAPADQRPRHDGQLLYFNHAYGVLDRETADAIEHSAYLREFANFQVRTTTGADGQVWTGRYLMGRETYLELFGVGDVPGQDGELGAGGLGISAERSGDLDRAAERLPGLGVPEPIAFRQTRDFGDGVPVPWFDAVLTTGEYDGFGAWGMEYRPEYFADPRGTTEPASYPGDVGRERYLPDAYRDHPMRDVGSIRLAVTRRDLDSTVPLLRAGGFTVHPAPGGGIVAQGGGTTIRFDAVPREEAGLREVTFALNGSEASRHVERIGRSVLTVGPGPRAVWTFGH
ncbi:DUF5829 family protein [Streptomyces sp. NPDC059852]|uniref:DUF5829 family protein n=1 Tax=Streptomyces sp. NPDC059852 TaxID=3346972 RepID=UPI003651FE16